MDRNGALFDVSAGALVALGLSFLPFSPFAGGVVTAARRDGGYLDGFGLGLAAGVAVAIPLAVLFVPALAIASSLGFGIAPSAPGYDLFLAIVAFFFLSYTVGLSGVGGLVGVWIRTETDWDLDPSRLF